MKFLAEDDKLTIQLEGLEVLWGFRRRLVIPRPAITSLKWTPQFAYTGNRFFRAGGTSLPGLLYAGTFRSATAWYFLFVRRPKGRNWLTGGSFTVPDVLDITTRGYAYERLMLSCQPDVGASLVAWF